MNINNKTSWLVGLLSGWGIKESWAKIIVGALAGALAVAGGLTGGFSDSGRAESGASDAAAVVDSVK